MPLAWLFLASTKSNSGLFSSFGFWFVQVLTVGLANWNVLAAQPGQAQVLYAIVVTGSVIAILPVMVLFLFLQRFWQHGLSLGGVKG